MHSHAHLKNSHAFVNVIVNIRFELMHVQKYLYTCISLLLKDSECLSEDLESTI